MKSSFPTHSIDKIPAFLQAFKVVISAAATEHNQGWASGDVIEGHC